jgi:uncharacterized membrane protein YdjX (TVP38/TMEM64 family)
VLAGLITAFAVAYAARETISFDGTAESVRTFVAATGWWGPPLFVALFAFRSIFLLPSVVLLTAGGICFGILGGAVLGAMGLTFSAALKFLIAHIAGRERLRQRLPARMRARLTVVDGRASAGVVGLATAYPIGPAEALHIAVILAGMNALPFFAAVAIGALVRAGSFSLVGDALVEDRGLLWAAVVLAALAAAPLALPEVRRRLFRRAQVGGRDGVPI